MEELVSVLQDLPGFSTPIECFPSWAASFREQTFLLETSYGQKGTLENTEERETIPSLGS